jgi:hypothetical protein
VVPQNTGASVASPANNAWAVAGTAMEGTVAALKGTSWKKAVVQETGCKKDHGVVKSGLMVVLQMFRLLHGKGKKLQLWLRLTDGVS